MPALPSSNPAQFVQGAPVLHVADVEASAAFYRDVLGFTWDFGDETYAVVWRDNSAIHFARGSGFILGCEGPRRSGADYNGRGEPPPPSGFSSGT